MKTHIITAVLAVALLCSAAIAADAPPDKAAAHQSPLDITLVVKKIVYLHGKEKQTDATHAEPGDVLEYRAEYKNIGTATLNGLSATLPLPEHTTFVTGSAYPAGSEVSTRSAKDIFTPLPLKDGIKNKTGVNGSLSENSYDALRWDIVELAPGQIAAIGARVRVDRSVSEKPPSAPLAVQAKPSVLQ